MSAWVDDACKLMDHARPWASDLFSPTGTAALLFAYLNHRRLDRHGQTIKALAAEPAAGPSAGPFPPGRP